MSENYVYIDAPTLDNSDQSKILIDKEFSFASMGSENKGDIARLPLYEKFVKSEWNSSLSFISLGRTEIKPGKWNLDKILDIDNGGDYILGNTIQVYSKIFQVGKLDYLRFRFYEPDEITNNISEHPSQISDYSAAVPKIAIFKNNSSGNYKFISYASYHSQDENGGIYKVDNNILISGTDLTTLNQCFAFIFLTPEHLKNISLDENVSYSFQGGSNNLRSIGCINNGYLGIASVPRGSLDNKSYICCTSHTNGTTNVGQNRLLDFDFNINVDLVEEFIGTNSKNHHLDMANVVELNKLRYSAPTMPSLNEYNCKKTSSAPDGDYNYGVYISDYSLTRGNSISLEGKNISSVQIPFRFTTNGDDYENGSTMIDWQFTHPNGLLNTNRQLYIAQGRSDGTGPEDNWICSDNIVAYSYFSDNLIYEFTFNNGTGIKYNGHGLYFKAAAPSGEVGNNTLGIQYFENKETGEKYSYKDNTEDKIITTTSRNGFNATAQIDVLFDYKTRSEWYNLMEEKINNLEKYLMATVNLLKDHVDY